MPLLRAFRLSTYLTLAVACLVLGYAEGDLLPESPYITALVIVLIAVAHRVEGRWSLSLQSANSVGAVLAVAVVIWIGFQFVRGSTGVLDLLPFPANLLPYLGPVLMILVPAKLFRPKHVGDFWAIQGVGLLAVTLGCAMANDFFFGALLIAYVFCFCWSLSLFFMYRELQLESLPWVSEGPPTPRGILTSAAAWTLMVATAGLAFYLVTPRAADRRWELSVAGRGRIETGFSDGSGIDLNHVGALEQNSEVAFEVYADDADGNPKLDLDPNQYWRASTFTHYDGGRWLRGESPTMMVEGRMSSSQRSDNPPDIDSNPRALRNARLPDFGPDAYYLTFTLQRALANAHVCAQPVVWKAKQAPPIYIFGTRSGPVQQHHDGELEWLCTTSGAPGYCQITVPLPERNLGPVIQVQPGYEHMLTRIVSEEVKNRMQRWTIEVLKKLERDGRLPAEAIRELGEKNRAPADEYHRAIAEALESYLARSGEFTYSVELIRKDKSVDPVEDFLFATRTGHCQRFATALAIMLRSIEIPAEVVIGFHGCEPQGDGNYVVRQLHAHAWVEALVPACGADGSLLQKRDGGISGTRPMQWLTLDPTPSSDLALDAKDKGNSWFGAAFLWMEAVIRSLIFGNDPGVRDRTISAMWNLWDNFVDAVWEPRFNWAKKSLAIILLLGTVLAVRRFTPRRRRPHASPRRQVVPVPFCARLLSLLDKAGHQPAAGQTTREFAAQVSQALRLRGVAGFDVPTFLCDSYYRVHYGGQELSPEENRQVQAALDRLEAALAGS